MSRGLFAALAVLAGLLSSSPAEASQAASTPVAHAAVAVPPALQALEQQTLALQLTSVRFSLSESFVGSDISSLFGELAPRGAKRSKHLGKNHVTPLIEGTGEFGFAPAEGSFQTSFLGIKSNGRLIGTTLYEEEPFVSSLDGGRPWVEQPNQSLQQATGVGLATLGGKPGSGAVEMFGGVLEAVNRARSIRELGAKTFAGQPVTAFAASVELDALYAADTAAQRKALSKLAKPLANVELLIAANGLPLRTQVKLELRGRHGGALIVALEIAAINFALTPVQAPPPNETISEAQLQKLLAPKRSARKRRHVVAVK